MSKREILSSDEVAALLEDADPAGGVVAFDLAATERIVRGRLPTLELINERLARHLRSTLFGFVRTALEVNPGEIEARKFDDFARSLAAPASLIVLRMRPLQGSALLVLEPTLVFWLIDRFFGGAGKSPDDGALEREPSATERKVLGLVVTEVLRAMKEAWAILMATDPEVVKWEVNPQFANIASPSETVIHSEFAVEFSDHSSSIHVCLPYSMVEPIREQLAAGVQSDNAERGERWLSAFREELTEAAVDLSALFGVARLTMREFVDLRPGHVIGIDVPDRVWVQAAGTRLFRGTFGVSGDRYAVKIAEFARLRGSPRAADGAQTPDAGGPS